MYARNNFGIDMMHVSAQGDQPLLMYFYKNRGMSLKTRDNRMSTPLHWAIYSKSEVAMCYLLSWDESLCDDQDCDGFTPLHLAVKSVEKSGHIRPVRTLLVRGSDRNAIDLLGKRAIDHIEDISDSELQR